jgi:hypothetical protein
VAEEINVGMLGMVPGAVPALQSAGLIRPEDQAMSGMTGEALRFAGTAIPFAAGIPAMGSAPGTIAKSGIIRSMVDDIATFARNRPGTYFGAELGAAAAAGAAGEAATQGGAGDAGRLAAEAAGGIVGGLALGTLPSSARRLKEGVLANLAPMREEGGMIRASRQMQSRAGGPDRASEFSRMLDDIPEGVTPAQWIGDSRLMAQEARLLIDNPDLQPVVQLELQEARMIAQESIKDSFGAPRSRQDWERSVLEKVSPPGTAIAPGMSDEMLDQAYRSFEPLYDTAKGFPSNSQGLRDDFISASNDDFIIATDDERSSVARWLSNQATAIENRDIPITTDELLNLRSRIRDERRRQVKNGNSVRADLLNSAESAVTGRIESSIPEESLSALRSADSQYRKYKVVENAIFSAGDRAFTPDQLSESIRLGGLTTTSRYARGQDESVQELRELALSGRSTEEILGDPRRAALFVRGLDDGGKKAVQNDFMNTLYNRAMESSTDATESGVGFVSGRRLLRDINDNESVMKSLGMSEDEVRRARRMAREIYVMEQKPPAAVASLFEDGPATLIDLAAALVGAKQGQAIAGRGMGSSLVLAQYMSNRARRIVSMMTSSQAEQLMKDATTDPELYRAMLTKSLSDTRAKERAAYLESWLLASALNTDYSGDQQ